jgi:hypothetical protein
LFTSSPGEKRCRKACLCPPPYGIAVKLRINSVDYQWL